MVNMDRRVFLQGAAAAAVTASMPRHETEAATKGEDDWDPGGRGFFFR